MAQRKGEMHVIDQSQKRKLGGNLYFKNGITYVAQYWGQFMQITEHYYVPQAHAKSTMCSTPH